ncbi:MAG TPA: alpha/beta hydrolase [Methylomirabilota bacterium]|nr:alpha/beta hydrolase [Methylomirabilota bacterium]
MMTRGRRGLLVAVALTLAAGAGPSAARAAEEEVCTVPARPGVTESFLLLRPERAAVATVIIFAGGDGNLALTPAGLGQLQGNFLVRTRQRWVREGFLVAILDTPSDHPRGLWNFRTTKEHAADVKLAIAAVRDIAPVPVWLVGTSMGPLSAANAAARIGNGGPDGVVLTSSVTATSKVSYETVLHSGLEDIGVPILVVHHKDDTCQASPYSGAEAIMKALKKAPATAPHGYLGLEPRVVSAIAAWIRAH